jgi:hypothetical protein
VKQHFPAVLGELVPGAYGEAIVTTVNSIAEERAQLAINRAFVLDRQIRDAAPRIQPVRSGESRGRADVQAAAAAAAVIDLGLIGEQIGRRQNRTEKQPRAMVTRYQVRMLPLPSQARQHSQRLFHQRRCIDEHLYVRAAGSLERASDALELGFQHIVIVAALRIDRDDAAIFHRQRLERIAVRRVGKS